MMGSHGTHVGNTKDKKNAWGPQEIKKEKKENDREKNISVGGKSQNRDGEAVTYVKSSISRSARCESAASSAISRSGPPDDDDGPSES